MASEADNASGQPRKDAPVYLGMFASRKGQPSFSVGEAVVLGVAALWAIAAGLFFLVLPDAGASASRTALGVGLLVVFLPIAIAGLAIYVARAVRLMQDESERLQLSINAMRQSLVQKNQSGVLEMTPNFERKLEEIAAAHRSTVEKLARFTSIRPDLEAQSRAALASAPQADEATQDGTEQASLALGTPASGLGHPLTVADFIRALNFPDDPDDKEGFRALRRALQDRNAAQLISAAQDVLTLLSQDGIYMDDLTPDRARPEIWRRFAKGERGKSIAILGGIRDRSSLALSAGRMRQDTIFRDSVHHFLRKFDHTFTEFEKTASDLDIVSLTDTRTARAFMLLGRVTGTFD